MPERTDQSPEQHSPAAEPLTYNALVDTVICPECRVAAGARCTTRSGMPAREPHGRRFEALEQAAGITAHRATVRSQRPEAWWSNGVDRDAEAALLASYAAGLDARTGAAREQKDSRVSEPTDHPSEQSDATDVALRTLLEQPSYAAQTLTVAARVLELDAAQPITGAARQHAIDIAAEAILGKLPPVVRWESRTRLDSALPPLTPISRGEYALLLRAAAKGL
jgi:hypothetical protein